MTSLVFYCAANFVSDNYTLKSDVFYLTLEYLIPLSAQAEGQGCFDTV